MKKPSAKKNAIIVILRSICTQINAHLEVHHTAVIHHLDGLVEEGGGVVIAVRFIENGQSELVLSRIDEIVDAEHIQKVHLIARVQGAVEIALRELRTQPRKQKSTFWR